MAVATSDSLRTRFRGLPEHRQGILAVTGAAVLFSSGGLFIKWVSLDALGLTMWRSLIAGVTIALITGLRPPKPWRAGWLEWALAISYALTLVLFVVATKLTTAANAIFLQFTAPLWVLLAGRFVLAERPSRTDVICIAVAFTGMALFFVGKLEVRDTAGNVSALASGVCFASFLILLRRPECRTETRPRSMMLGNALLVVTLLVVNAARLSGDSFTPGARDIGGLLFLGVLQIGLAYVLFGYGIARIPALEVSLIGMLEPVLNPVWVFAVLGETPGWWAVLGGTIIVAAVGARTVVSERRRGRVTRVEG